MITIKDSCFLSIGQDQQTPNKVTSLQIHFRSSVLDENIGTNDNPEIVKQGYVTCWLEDERGNQIMHRQYKNEQIEGQSILDVATADYLLELKSLNKANKAVKFV